METTSLVLIGLFFLAVNIPCIAIIWLGNKFFDQIGRYPSKTSAIQTGIALKIFMIEVVAFTVFLALYKVLSGDSSQ